MPRGTTSQNILPPQHNHRGIYINGVLKAQRLLYGPLSRPRVHINDPTLKGLGPMLNPQRWQTFVNARV
jgi:hypothetical protein